MFSRDDLPADLQQWDPIFLSVMGSPDPNGRQLNGMGGGLSSVSKVCVVGRSLREDADVEYTFAQVAIDKAAVSYSSNCGNMLAAVGPFAVSRKIVPAPRDGEASIRIFNTNTGKIVHARFAVEDGIPVETGEFRMDGVAGTGAPVRLTFVDPVASQCAALLPTGEPIDRLPLPGGGMVEATCADAGVPCVFVRAADLGCSGHELPAAIEADTRLMAALESIRRHAAIRMRMAADLDAAGLAISAPKVAMFAAPSGYASLSGADVAGSEYDIAIRMISVGQPHRAIPVTGSICAAVAAGTKGTLLNAIAGRKASIRIGHASGVTVVGLTSDDSRDLLDATIVRTARLLFDGRVYYGI